MVYHDVTHFVVVDPLRQPLASKSDRRPVGMLQPGQYSRPEHSGDLRGYPQETILAKERVLSSTIG
jgi:hypothetical protein